MADVYLKIDKDKADRTRTKISVRSEDVVVFTNVSDEALRITVGKNDALFDAEDITKEIDLFKVAGGATKKFRVNKKYCGSEFKFTATIGSSQAEDSIIIVEK
jgi:hypothetical protein